MNASNLVKSFSRRTFFQSLFFFTLLAAIAVLFLSRAGGRLPAMDRQDYGLLFIFLAVYGILQWLFQRNTLKKLAAGLSTAPARSGKTSPQPQPPTDDDRNRRRNHERRLFVHLFSVLQREGRLMDFLQEDLSMYEDHQIGAAVRDVHANCRKTLRRYLKPEPVMAQAEGETVTVEAGFDPQAVKLVGNVVGQPPFMGILRHRGWRLRKVALPELSATENPDIIAPAEIEIQ